MKYLKQNENRLERGRFYNRIGLQHTQKPVLMLKKPVLC